jgi:hypothetical protein
MRRRLLGTVSGLLTRTRVYLAADAIEVDEIEGYTGTRRRVLLDEVLLVTLDRRRRLVTVVIWLVFAAVFFLPTLSVGRTTGKEEALIAGLFLASPFLLGALLHLVSGVDFVTVFGKRGVAQIAFSFRKRRAKEVFALLRDRAQQAQDRARGTGAQPPPPAGSTSA